VICCAFSEEGPPRYIFWDRLPFYLLWRLWNWPFKNIYVKIILLYMYTLRGMMFSLCAYIMVCIYIYYARAHCPIMSIIGRKKFIIIRTSAIPNRYYYNSCCIHCIYYINIVFIGCTGRNESQKIILESIVITSK